MSQDEAAAEVTEIRCEGNCTQPATVGDDQGSDLGNPLQPATSE